MTADDSAGVGGVKFCLHICVMLGCNPQLGVSNKDMRKILAAAAFALAVPGLVFTAAPAVRAASILSPAKTVVVDVIADMGAIHQVRGSNRYKEQLRTYLHLGENGDGHALRQVGFHYAKGWGVIRDFTKAYMWFTLAGQLGNADALENRDSMIRFISKAEIARAMEMAADWLACRDWEIEAGNFGDG